MYAEQLHMNIQTIDIAGRRRWLLWGERKHEFHLQVLLPAAERGEHCRTLCGRPIEPESRAVFAPDTHICRHCVQAAQTQYRNH